MNKSNNYVLVSIVLIVAIVAIITLFAKPIKTTTEVTENLGGQAYTKTHSKESYNPMSLSETKDLLDRNGITYETNEEGGIRDINSNNDNVYTSGKDNSILIIDRATKKDAKMFTISCQCPGLGGHCSGSCTDTLPCDGSCSGTSCWNTHCGAYSTEQ